MEFQFLDFPGALRMEFRFDDGKPLINISFFFLVQPLISRSLRLAFDSDLDFSKYIRRQGRRDRVYLAPFPLLCFLSLSGIFLVTPV